MSHATIGAAEILSRAEVLELASYERTIERGLNTFIEVGTALAQISEGRLYRASHNTFEDYCAERWGFTGRRGRQLIDAAAIGTIVPVENEGQARALVDVPEADRAAVFQDATEETDGKPTAAAIRKAAEARKPDLCPTILEALTAAGRDGLDAKRIVAEFPEEPSEKDLTRALDKLIKAGEVVVTATWGGNQKARKWASAAAFGDITPDVESVLATGGAGGVLLSQVVFLVGTRREDKPTPERVQEALDLLLFAGKAVVVAESGAGPLWALTRLLPPETPEPVAPTAPAGSGQDHPTDTGEGQSAGLTSVSSTEESPGGDATAGAAHQLPADDAENERKRAERQRDSRELLRRIVLLAWSPNWPEGHVESWVDRLGAHDDELEDLITRAKRAVAVLTELIEKAER